MENSFPYIIFRPVTGYSVNIPIHCLVLYYQKLQSSCQFQICRTNVQLVWSLMIYYILQDLGNAVSRVWRYQSNFPADWNKMVNLKCPPVFINTSIDKWISKFIMKMSIDTRGNRQLEFFELLPPEHMLLLLAFHDFTCMSWSLITNRYMVYNYDARLTEY